MLSFPPAPWLLEGAMHVSLWRMPAARFPPDCLPNGARLVTAFGQALVGTGWGTYGPGGVLAYNEVLAATLVRLGGKTFTTITHIWVDHPASVAGARALWAIPKELAAFERMPGADFRACATTPDGNPLAVFRFRRRATLPGRWPWHLHTVHDQAERTEPRFAHARASACLEPGSAAWTFASEGPLAFLRHARPLASTRLARLSLLFGAEDGTSQEVQEALPPGG